MVRARRATLAYRALALRYAPIDEVDFVDNRLKNFGEGWITPEPQRYDDHELITTEQAAQAARVDAATIYAWVNRKRVTAHKVGRENRYLAGEIYRMGERTRHRG